MNAPLPPPENHSLVVVCSNEAHCGGCSISVALTRASSPALLAPVVSRVNDTAANLAFSFGHGAAVSVNISAVDGVGNHAFVIYRWAVETETPVTLWPPVAPFTNDTALVLPLNCSKPAGCSYEYNLDGTGWKPVGNSSVNVPVTASNAVDTEVVASPPLVSRSPSASFEFAARVPAGEGGTAAVDVRLNGAPAWTPVPANLTYTVSGLADGAHTLEARARYVLVPRPWHPLVRNPDCLTGMRTHCFLCLVCAFCSWAVQAQLAGCRRDSHVPYLARGLVSGARFACVNLSESPRVHGRCGLSTVLTCFDSVHCGVGQALAVSGPSSRAACHGPCTVQHRQFRGCGEPGRPWCPHQCVSSGHR